jgi:hypothetical protein
MEAASSSEMSIDFQHTAWYYIPEDGTLYNRLCSKLISYVKVKVKIKVKVKVTL